MLKDFLPRLDKDRELLKLLEKYCRLRPGEVWEDSVSGHRVGCIDCTNEDSVNKLLNGTKASLAVHDPPYNFVAFNKLNAEEFTRWSAKWIEIGRKSMKEDCSLYVWLGADQKHHYEPFPEFILMMKSSGFKSKSFITMRNQRGYGTSKNWMALRQELLYYVKGEPVFNIGTVYTQIPKAVKGYYKEIGGVKTENLERSKSEYIRAGNVWIDIQQVFHLMSENVNGCFAQKPLKAIERIISASSMAGDAVIDFFSHSGTTLLACEKNGRKCFTSDIEPVFCEISIRRLEHYRLTGNPGWQMSNPFTSEIEQDEEIRNYINNKYR